MGIEINAAHAGFMGERWHFLDCPGSIEFMQETLAALMVCDVAIVVCEPEAERVQTLGPIFHALDEYNIPYMIYVNKLDTANGRVPELMEALQLVSSKPLALRHVPIRDGETITGYVDLVSERAYLYKPGNPSALIKIPDSVQDRNEGPRQELLEILADFNDDLLEKLLEDVVPPKDEVYEHLTQDLRSGDVSPVFLGAAEKNHGVFRLLKALRHETPEATQTLERLIGIEGGAEGIGGEPAVQVFKTYQLPHTGKLSLARVWKGSVKDGSSFGNNRVSGLSVLMGHSLTKTAEGVVGDVIGGGAGKHHAVA